MILGGRFVQSEFKGSAMGLQFEGSGVTGYDNYKKRYVGTWMDTWGTMIMVLEGGAENPSGKTIEMSAICDDPATGKKVKFRMVTTIVDNDKHLFDMFMTPEGGTESKCTSIVYTRAQ
jgi:hypothetical protein